MTHDLSPMTPPTLCCWIIFFKSTPYKPCDSGFSKSAILQKVCRSSVIPSLKILSYAPSFWRRNVEGTSCLCSLTSVVPILMLISFPSVEMSIRFSKRLLPLTMNFQVVFLKFQKVLSRVYW